jgi:hypothetical protein
MKKYASDLNTNDRLIAGDREVVLDLLDYNYDTGMVTVLGYFEDHGNDFHTTVYPDKVFTVK